jgi:hypothetical protein
MKSEEKPKSQQQKYIPDFDPDGKFQDEGNVFGEAE